MFTACSDDENSGSNGSTSKVNNPLLNEGKMLLTSISCLGSGQEKIFDYLYSYDEKLRPYREEKYCSAISGREEHYFLYTIDYDNGKLLDWDEDNCQVFVSFNSKGYIDKVKGLWISEYDGECYVSMDWNTSYDKDGHLTKLITNVDLYDEEPGKLAGKVILDWKDGCLMSININEVKYDHNGTEIASSDITQTFTYGKQKNRFKQYPAICYADDDTRFFAVGLFGIGPDLLPIAENTVSVIGHNKYSSNSRATYTLNANGSIDTETWLDQNNNIMKFVFGYTAASLSDK